MNDSKAILSDNIRAMIGSGTIRGWAISNHLDPKQVSRTVNQETSISLDALDKIASSLGLKAAQLLTPGGAESNASLKMDQLALLMSKLPDDELVRLKAHTACVNALITFLEPGA